MESDTCPVCKADRYLNPNLKLMVSPCFHKMCQTCIDRLFTSGPSPCPICKQTLKKSLFVNQTFEDLLVEKEIQIRKKVGKLWVYFLGPNSSFNKRLENFGGDLKAYNDYLEEVEDILFNLINDIDVQKTQERIEKFRQENKEIIAQNLAKQMHEEKLANYKREKEKKEKTLRKEAYLMHLHEEEKQRMSNKQEILEKLATSNTSFDEILKKSQEKAKTTFSLIEVPSLADEFDDQFEFETIQDFDPMDEIYEDPNIYSMEEHYEDIITSKFKQDKKARGGGYDVRFSYSRALSAGYYGIFTNVIPA